MKGRERFFCEACHRPEGFLLLALALHPHPDQCLAVFLLDFIYTWNDLALSSVKYPSGRVISYEYDAAARAVSVTGQVGTQAATTYVAGVNYAEHGGVEQVQFGNARYERTCYNDRLQASAIVLRTAPPVSACADSTANLAVLGFGYGQASENNGNLRTQTVSDGAAWSANQSYEYDALNRLQSALESGTTGWKVTFGHDRWGNRWWIRRQRPPTATRWMRRRR